MRLLLWFAVCLGLVGLVRSDLGMSLNITDPLKGFFDLFKQKPIPESHENNPSTEKPTTQNLPKNNPSTENPPKENPIIRTHFDLSSIFFPTWKIPTVLINLHEAINAKKPDEDTIITIISTRTHRELDELKKSYQKLYELELIQSLRSVLTGELEKAVISWMVPRNYYYAQEIHRTLYGLGADERPIIDILCTSNHSIIQNIRNTYSALFFRNMENDLMYTLEFFKSLLHSSEKKNQSHHITSYHNVVAIAEDELSFLDFLANHPSDVFQFAMEYYQQSGKYLENTIMEKYSGDLERTLLSIVYYAKGENRFFARRLHDCLESDIVDYDSLIRLAIMDKRVSYDEICDIYKKQYRRELDDVMSRKIRSGKFRKFIEALFKRQQEPSVYEPVTMQ